jgi:DNA polymerase-3 subunit delta
VTLSPAEVKAQLAAGTVAPVYVLTGPDERDKSELAGTFADLVEPELRAFNVERFYGADAEAIDDVVEAARTLPMLGDRRVVIVMQAERILSPKRKAAEEEADDGEAPAAGDIQAIIDCIERPSDRTVLVFVLSPAEPPTSGKRHDLLPLNGSLRVTRLLAKTATIVEVGQFTSERDLVRWLNARAREAGVTVQPDAAQALVDASGDDPAALRTHVERVLTFAKGEGAITLAHVEAAIVVHETSSDAWAIARAVEQGDAAAALREARVRLEDGDSPFAMMGQLAYAVRNPPPRGRYPAAKLAKAVDALFRTDVALKSSGGDPRVLIERLIVELCG